MKNEKRLTIAFINDYLSFTYAFLPWRGAANAANNHGINLVAIIGQKLRTPSGYYQQENVLYDIAKTKRIDGYIIWKGNLSVELSDAEFKAFCTGFHKPFVTIEGSIPGHPAITYGNYEGMRMAIDHLIETHGYTKIGYVGHMKSERHTAFQARYRAYHDSMQDHSLSIDPSFVVPFREWDPPINGLSMNEALDVWLKVSIPRGLEAVTGICDAISLWVIKRCIRLGYSVPDDLAVVGYDNTDKGVVSDTPLTTVDPCWSELGVLALKTIIDIIHGKPVPERHTVEAKLVMARSCGCIQENIKLARMISEPADGKKDDSNSIIENMLEAVHETGNEQIRSLCSSMLSCFDDEKQENMEYRFLSNLEKALMVTIEAGNDVLVWQNALSILQKYCVTRPGSAGALSSNILCHQGRIMIGNAASRQQLNLKILNDEQRNTERNLGLNLITTFDLDRLLDLLADGLPGLGISRFYVSLFENPKQYVYPEPAPAWSRLIIAHNDKGRIGLESEGVRYRTRDILPDPFWQSEKPLTMCINTLYFQETLIGLLMFDAIPGVSNILEVFSVHLSNALKGVLLLKELTMSNEQLARSYSDLQRNMQILIATEKMASLGRLSAGIAHEMNTPLAVVRTSLRELGFLVDEYKNSINNPVVTAEDHKDIAADMLENIMTAMRAAEKSAGFIKGIKSQANPNSTVINQSFNVRELVDDTLIVLQFLFKKNNCTIEKNLQNEVFLFGSPRAFIQIITNLIVNAVDACKPDGGTITISLSESKDQSKVLKIRDTGSGIAEEHIRNIFEPFFTTKPFGEGTGLGLSIVYDLVNEFGGNIDVESVPGNTVFRITFPFRQKS